MSLTPYRDAEVERLRGELAEAREQLQTAQRVIRAMRQAIDQLQATMHEIERMV